MKPSEEDVARRFTSPEGMEVLVGRTARDNDVLTFQIASQRDFWLHVAGSPGSHVIVRNPEGLESLPRETLRYAAALAARHSKARDAGRVTVHVARVKDVTKPGGAPPGQVSLKRYRSVRASVAP
ncbi:MAG TPA: NFACT RNA binding domain-containing protein [Vicinamibacteria bacterium]|jgi:predicted ribosome quality control (RQC) complex YloA/Tae2 family protein